MKVTDHHVFYNAVEHSVSILFENDRKLAVAEVTMSIDRAIQLGRDLSTVMNNASDKDARTRPADNPEQRD